MDSMESSNTIGARAQREFEDLLKHDRAVVVAALVFVIAASWLYLLAGAGTGMSPFEMSSLSMAIGASGGSSMGPPMTDAMGQAMVAMATPAGWTWAYAFLMFGMWWVMMIAMMLPSAAPMILLYARVVRHGPAHVPGAVAPTATFAAGYLVCWFGFSALATGLQFALERSGLLDGMMMWSTERWLTAGLLVGAGLYQLSPLKTACLTQCRSPAEFLTRHWRAGRLGAFRMGVVHGAYCLGCCWFLMTLLFFGGVMNLWWIGGLAAYVLLEKLMPMGHWLGYAVGAALVGWGAWLLAIA